jgi:hypothetical protein
MGQWALLAAAAITGVIAVVRDLIGLRRERDRREAVRLLVERAGHGGYVMDGGAGGPIWVHIGTAGDSPTGAVRYDRGRPAR